jgi:hypothetical protein
MSALSATQRSRHAELEKQLRAALLGASELNDGYAFEFPPDPEVYAALTQLTPLEHACCPFFDISIRLEHGGRLFWQLTGSEGVKQFIRMEFGDFF